MLLRVLFAIVLVSVSSAAPSNVRGPKDVFGFRPGDDYKLASHAQLVEYFRTLDAASDRIVVEDIGSSVEGRPLILAIVSSEANIKNRARYKEIARRLALARGVGDVEARVLAKEGKAKPGYNSHIQYDMWWNGSMRGAPDFHNMAGFLTETVLYRYATPKCYTPEEIPETFGERHGHLPAKMPSVNYTNPWLGGCWPLRQPVEYMLTASRATLDIAAKMKEDFLFDNWRMGTRQIARGEKAQGGPFAYVIDLAAQHDPTRTIEFLRTLRTGGVEIRRADAAFSAGGRQYPAGTYVIGPQAFRPYVVDLMEPKTFPERRLYPGGPPDPPYDMTGYELGLQMGVQVDRVRDAFPLPATTVDAVAAAPGGIDGGAGASAAPAAYALSPNLNLGVKAINRLLKAGAKVAWTEDQTVIVEGGKKKARKLSDVSGAARPTHVLRVQSSSEPTRLLGRLRQT